MSRYSDRGITSLTQLILTETMHVLCIKRPVRPIPSWLDQRAERGLTRHDSHLDGIAIRGDSLLLFEGCDCPRTALGKTVLKSMKSPLTKGGYVVRVCSQDTDFSSKNQKIYPS